MVLRRRRSGGFTRAAFVTASVILLGALGIQPAAANDIHEAAYDGSNYDYIKDAGTSTEHSLGQGFTTSGEYAGVKVHHVALWMQRVGTAENACVWVSIRATYNGADLASKCVNAQTISTSTQWVDFIFSSPVSISPGGTYFIYARYYGSCDTCMRLFYGTSDSYRGADYPYTVIGQDNASCCWYRYNNDLAFLLAVDHTPSIYVVDARNIGSTTARFVGGNSDDAGGLATNIFFRWGAGNYNNTTSSFGCPGGYECWMDMTGLQPNTSYQFKACGTNSVGEQCSTGAVFFTTYPANDPPYTPNSPAPWDGETGVSNGSSVYWSGGDPNGDSVTYDVYLNAGSSATTLRCSGTSSTSCPNSSLGGLAAGTQYAWRVVARDSNGATTNGPTWHFTVANTNQAPYTPSSPSPTDLATNVSTGTNLSFSGGDPNGDAVTYDVYLNAGTSATTLRCNDAPTPYCGNGSLGGLAAATQYAWRVVSNDGQGGVTNGTTWRFTTGSTNTPSPPQSPAVTAPAAAQLRVAWSAPSSNGGSPITKYKVRGSASSTGPWTSLGEVNATQLYYVESGLQPGERFYQVTAVNALGLESAPSVAAGGRAYADFDIELKAWIPHAKVTDPIVEFLGHQYYPIVGADAAVGPASCQSSGYWYVRTPNWVDGTYDGDNHVPYDGTSRVRSRLTLRWDGLSISNLAREGGQMHGITRQRRVYRDLGLYDESCLLASETAQDTPLAYQHDSESFVMSYSSSNPRADRYFGEQSPTIDATVTGTFIPMGLLLEFQVDNFPTHAIRVKKNGVVQATVTATQASCVDGTSVFAIDDGLNSSHSASVLIQPSDVNNNSFSWNSNQC